LRPEEVWHPHRGGRPGNRNALKTGQHTARMRGVRQQIATFIARACAVAEMVEAEVSARERERTP